MPIKLVIFDLDGTLVDSLDDLTAATNRMLADCGRPPLNREEVRRFVGQGAGRLVERALPGASPDEVERALTRFLAHNEAHIADRTVLYPGAVELLQTLSARGITLALLSNKHVALCRKLLALLGIDRYFTVVLGADSLPQRKPSPEPVLKILRDAGVSAERAVMVGDSSNDITAGQGAGVVTVACAYGYGFDEELEGAGYRIESLRELLQLPLFGRNQLTSDGLIR
jgi:phosphoglycolate phosphatase